MGNSKKIIFLILTSLIFNITIVKAEECNEEKIKELKKNAENIYIDTEFSYKSKDAGVYNSNYVTIQGLNEQLYIYTDDFSVLFTSDQQDETGKITRIVKSNVKKLNVYSDVCPNETIKSIKIKLQKFNPYSEYKECKEINKNNLEVCNEFYDKEITEKEFYEEIKKYQENKKINNGLISKNKLIKILITTFGIIIIIFSGLFIKKKIKDNKLD